MRVKVERSFLVRQVQVWEIEMPDDTVMDHVLAEHDVEFDEHLLSDGNLIDEHPVFLDEHDLELKILEGQPARVIHLHERKKR